MLILFVVTMSVCTCWQIYSGIARERGGGECGLPSVPGRIAPPPEEKCQCNTEANTEGGVP